MSRAKLKNIVIAILLVVCSIPFASEGTESLAKEFVAAGTPAGFFISAGSAVYSVKKFGIAEKDLIEKSRVLHKGLMGSHAINEEFKSKLEAKVKKGDLITIDYYLSQEESRKFLIEDLKLSIEEHEKAKQAAQKKSQRIRAIHSVTRSDRAKSQYHQALSETIKFSDNIEHLKRELIRIEGAYRVDEIRVTEAIDTSKVSLREWLDRKSNLGYQIHSVKQLPFEARRIIAKSKLLAKTGIAGVAAGILLSVSSPIIYYAIEDSSAGQHESESTSRPTSYKRIAR